MVSASRETLERLLGTRAGARVHAALRTVDVAEERRRMRAAGVSGVLPGDPDWPALLETIPAAPLALPGWVVERPIFVGKKLIGWVALSAHLADMGGMAVGSFAPGATERFRSRQFHI